MHQKQKKSSPKSLPAEARTAPDEGLETFLKEIGIDDEGDRKPLAAGSRRISAGGTGKDDDEDEDEDELFKGSIEPEKMETEDEKGDEEEEPSEKE